MEISFQTPCERSYYIIPLDTVLRQLIEQQFIEQKLIQPAVERWFIEPTANRILLRARHFVKRELV